MSPNAKLGKKRGESNEDCSVCGGEGEYLELDEKGRVFYKRCARCDARKTLTKTLRAACFPNVEEVALNERCVDYWMGIAQGNGKKWLYLPYEDGSGTAFAVRIGKEFLKKFNLPTRYYDAIEFATLTGMQNASKRADFVESFTSVEFAILDDFLGSVPRKNCFAFDEYKAFVLSALWARYAAKKPLVITSRRSFDEIAEFDVGIASRIADACGLKKKVS